jgi:hypothetical protein
MRDNNKKSCRHYLLVLILAFSILCCRNLNPLTLPTLYAEDGMWVSHLLDWGFWRTAFNARDNFPVLGIVTLQWFSVVLNFSILNLDITQLPYVIYFISNVTLASIFLHFYVVMRRVIGDKLAIYLFIYILLVPVGDSGDEIFGRILNLGWYTVILAFSLFLEFLFLELSKFAILIRIGLLCFLCLTFPVVYGQLIVFAFIFMIYNKGKIQYGFTLRCLGIVLILLMMVLLRGHITSKGGAIQPVDYANLVEFAFARLLLFPLTSIFYSSLTNAYSLFLAGSFFSLLIYAYTNSTNSNSKRFLLFTISMFLVIFLSTVVMRMGLTAHFRGYTTSYPDRYFLTGNLFFIILVFAVINAWHGKSLKFNSVLLIVPFIWILTSQILFSNPTVTRGSILSLRQIICDVNAGLYKGKFLLDEGVIPIYPFDEGLPWRVVFPKELIDKSVSLHCK